MAKESECQAEAQFKNICELIYALGMARRDADDRAIDAVYDRIYSTALSVAVRSGWQAPQSKLKPAEYSLLLCTGGPAVRLVGELDQYCEPETARLERQDWFTPWEIWGGGDEEKLLEFARCFYFANE